MTTTMHAIRRGAAACLFTAIVAGTLAPGFASAHHGSYWPATPAYDIRRATDSPHDSIVVTWQEAHGHGNRHEVGRFLDYRIYVRESRDESLDRGTCASLNTRIRPPDGCISRITSLAGPDYSETITGLIPDRLYYVWLGITYLGANSPGGELIPRGTWLSSRRAIRTLPRPTTPTPTTPAPHTHNYAASDHSHGTPLHSHGYAPAVHTHRYAAVDHTHAAGTGETAPATSSTTTAAQTCPRFIELVSPYTYSSHNGGAPRIREHIDASVWVAVDTIEYMRERTVKASLVIDGDEDIEGVEVRLKGTHNTFNGNFSSNKNIRAFILEGAALADVAASVRCQTAPVAVTTEDPPAAQ